MEAGAPLARYCGPCTPAAAIRLFEQWETACKAGPAAAAQLHFWPSPIHAVILLGTFSQLRSLLAAAGPDCLKRQRLPPGSGVVEACLAEQQEGPLLLQDEWCALWQDLATAGISLTEAALGDSHTPLTLCIKHGHTNALEALLVELKRLLPAADVLDPVVGVGPDQVMGVGS